MRSDLTEFQPRHHIDTSGSDVFSPYDHQTAAWDALDRHFGSLQQKSGILVVPTGGGKTASATRWLTQHHIAKGGRVLWFAHRQILLKQAFRAMSALGATAGEPPALPSVLSLSGLARALAGCSRRHGRRAASAPVGALSFRSGAGAYWLLSAPRPASRRRSRRCSLFQDWRGRSRRCSATNASRASALCSVACSRLLH
ncbi:MAG: hypothetical protein CO108_30430 [Deltaproteobacteria bacterium CG_4_9_14_3_um_filter_63_12]|nr:MAG: hypothetical protein CO108_30430 [Deltaproteobacteria bacterium CG_4_9_14_3_um_filter_63_12]